MKMAGAAQVSLVLALIAGCFVAEAARHRIKVRESRITFKIDWWDNTGRAEPYRIIWKKSGVKSVYRFDQSGNMKTLTIGTTRYTFTSEEGLKFSEDGLPEVQSSDIGSRMLLASEQEEEDEADEDQEVSHSEHRRLYDCPDCENTWDTVCGVSIVDVCSWVPFLPDVFNEDAQYSLTKMCDALGAACDGMSAFDTCDGICVGEPAPEPTPAPTDEPEPTPAPTDEPEPTPAPTDAPEPTPAPSDDPEPTPAPSNDPIEPTDACNPNPCLNGGSCSLDPAGGRTCSCASNFGGISCQTDTSSLASFYIELDFIGTWTNERRAVFQSAADRWAEVVTHVPCGGSTINPAGRLLISATLEAIDGAGGTLGSAGPSYVWSACPSVSISGNMKFDIDDIVNMENRGTFEGVILHEMGHVIGVGTTWGEGFGDCTRCREVTGGDASWTCPAAVSAYADIGGSGNAIVELDGGGGTACGHLDESLFNDELMTGYVNNVMYLSKMTAAILDDLDYVVDPSAVDSYILPSERGASISAGPSTLIHDTVVDKMIFALDGDDNVVEEKAGVNMEF